MSTDTILIAKVEHYILESQPKQTRALKGIRKMILFYPRKLLSFLKVCHYLQYPPGTTVTYFYFESQGGKFENTLFFGLQYLLKRWLVGPVITAEKVLEAKEFFRLHFNQELFNELGWMHVVEVSVPGHAK